MWVQTVLRIYITVGFIVVIGLLIWCLMLGYKILKELHLNRQIWEARPRLDQVMEEFKNKLAEFYDN